MSLKKITNYREISDRLTSSGQPDEMQFKEIAAAGFEVIINLAMPNSDNAIPEEGYIITARKMTYVHLPVPFEAPTVEHLRSFFALMQAFESKKCWIHCVVNYRASAFLYQYYRLVLHANEEEARKVILEEWEPNAVWQEFMALDAKNVW
ncbi:MAG: protein tyrosine phosphatase family protein [Sedimenticola sp.]